MKFLLIAAAVVAVAVAGPTRFVQPGVAGPAPIIDINPNDVLSIGPAIIDDSPISIGPAIIDESEIPIHVDPVIPPPLPSPVTLNRPLVQVIVNVNGGTVTGNPVVVDKPEIEPTPVIVVEHPEIEPTPVIVVEQPEIPEPVIVAPIDVAPVITLPDTLN